MRASPLHIVLGAAMLAIMTGTPADSLGGSTHRALHVEIQSIDPPGGGHAPQRQHFALRGVDTRRQANPAVDKKNRLLGIETDPDTLMLLGNAGQINLEPAANIPPTAGNNKNPAAVAGLRMRCISIHEQQYA